MFKLIRSEISCEHQFVSLNFLINVIHNNILLQQFNFKVICGNINHHTLGEIQRHKLIMPRTGIEPAPPLDTLNN